MAETMSANFESFIEDLLQSERVRDRLKAQLLDG